MSFKEDFEQTYKVLQRVHNKLTMRATVDSYPLLRDDIVNVLCLLGSPLFTHLVDLDASLAQLSRLSRRPVHLDPDDFELDPCTCDLVLDRKSQHFSSAIQMSDELGKAAVENMEMMLERVAHGRQIEVIELYKGESGSLGFGVVGLRSELHGEIGIFVQEIQPGGIAAKDGRLAENDQILAINDQVLNAGITHQQAINILQSASGRTRLLVARSAPHDNRSDDSRCLPVDRQLSQSAAAASETLDMVLNTEWTQVEVITLVNDGSGLGFGIIGGKSTGVVVKTILPGGVADRDGRLHSGDHLLQIGDINVRGMGSEQVAAVLRQSGTHVHLIVARGVVEPSLDFPPYAPIIPTVQLTDHLRQLNEALLLHGGDFPGYIIAPDDGLDNTTTMFPAEIHPHPVSIMLEPEVEVFEVELVKDNLGLGITIAGYVSDKPSDDLSGIFVRGIVDGSAAALDGRIQIHDQIIAVDGVSLDGFNNQQAVDILRNTGKVIHLKLVRHKFGSKYEQLLQASAIDHVNDACSRQVIAVDDIQLIEADDIVTDLPKDTEDLAVSKWRPVVGPQFEIIIAQVCKFKEGGGLGISLEGTVDVEDGVEVHPHHYIRSVLPDGPVGLSGRLRAGDELLQVNDSVLYGRNHVEVVSILKDLPRHVAIVCARRLELCNEHPLTGMAHALFKAKSEQVLAAEAGSDSGVIRAHSLEPLSGLATWCSDVVTVELHKGDRGLGFSILDYQDPLNPAETVIVIRSLVPGGVAQLDGRLVPGDRLMFVNDIGLENASLDEAVQALKGAPRGRVILGVAKPLPLPEIGESSTDDFVDEQRLLCESPSVYVHMPPVVPLSSAVASSNQKVQARDHEFRRADNADVKRHSLNGLGYVESQFSDNRSTLGLSNLRAGSPPSVITFEMEGPLTNQMTSTPVVKPSENRTLADSVSSLSQEQLRNFTVTSPQQPSVVKPGLPPKPKVPYRSPSLVEALHKVPPAALRRNKEEDLGFVSSAMYPTPTVNSPHPVYQVDTDGIPVCLAVSPSGSSSSFGSGSKFTRAERDVIFASSLEQTITIQKGVDALGLIVETVDTGLNGCVVKSLVDSDAVAKDGRVHVGDFIVNVGGESLRRVTNAQARAILRRSSQLAGDIRITFIAASDIDAECKVQNASSGVAVTCSNTVGSGMK